MCALMRGRVELDNETPACVTPPAAPSAYGWQPGARVLTDATRNCGVAPRATLTVVALEDVLSGFASTVVVPLILILSSASRAVAAGTTTPVSSTFCRIYGLRSSPLRPTNA